MPDNPFTLTVRATVTVTDLPALVRQVDELVAVSGDLWPTEDGTFFDGWEEREGWGYTGESGAVWLDDDPQAMLDLAVSLSPLRARGVDLELDADVTAEAERPGSPDSRFTVKLTVHDAAVTQLRSASAWLGAVKNTWPVILGARAAPALLESLAGCEVRITSAVAEQDDLPPGSYVDARQAEISLLPSADPDPARLPPVGERIVVTKGAATTRPTSTDDCSPARPATRPTGRCAGPCASTVTPPAHSCTSCTPSPSVGASWLRGSPTTSRVGTPTASSVPWATLG